MEGNLTVDREKMIFSFKAFLCIFLIALWSFWFTNSSREKIQKKIIKHSYHVNNEYKTPVQVKESEEKINAQEKEVKAIESNKPASNTKTADTKNLKEKIILQNNLVKELPKLETLTPVKTNIEKNKPKKEEVSIMQETKVKIEKLKTENSIPKEMINLNLPETASATRKVLLNGEKKNQEAYSDHNTQLRKGIPVERGKLKPVSINLKENKTNDLAQKINLGEGWLPKYLEETKESESKPKDIIDSPDKIAEQIEISGIVNKPNGESTAIIKNKTNNYIEILKKGDEYKGLKLLEINKGEVVLGSETRTYIKRINTGN